MVHVIKVLPPQEQIVEVIKVTPPDGFRNVSWSRQLLHHSLMRRASKSSKMTPPEEVSERIVEQTVAVRPFPERTVGVIEEMSHVEQTAPAPRFSEIFKVFPQNGATHRSYFYNNSGSASSKGCRSRNKIKTHRSAARHQRPVRIPGVEPGHSQLVRVADVSSGSRPVKEETVAVGPYASLEEYRDF